MKEIVFILVFQGIPAWRNVGRFFKRVFIWLEPKGSLGLYSALPMFFGGAFLKNFFRHDGCRIEIKDYICHAKRRRRFDTRCTELNTNFSQASILGAGIRAF